MSSSTRRLNGTFKTGHSGNPKGAPPKSQRPSMKSALDILKDNDLDPPPGDLPPDVPLEHEPAFRIFQQALKGAKKAQWMIAKHVLRRHEELRERNRPPVISRRIPRKETGCISGIYDALKLLDIVVSTKTLNYDDELVDVDKLRNWIIPEAMKRRRGGKRLHGEEEYVIQRATEDPKYVRWPRERVSKLL